MVAQILTKKSRRFFSAHKDKEIRMITATYEELFTFENIYKAHMRSRMCRRDKRPVVRFEMNMLSGLYDLYRRLNDGTFRF